MLSWIKCIFIRTNVDLYIIVHTYTSLSVITSYIIAAAYQLTLLAERRIGAFCLAKRTKVTSITIWIKESGKNDDFVLYKIIISKIVILNWNIIEWPIMMKNNAESLYVRISQIQLDILFLIVHSALLVVVIKCSFVVLNSVRKVDQG